MGSVNTIYPNATKPYNMLNIFSRKYRYTLCYIIYNKNNQIPKLCRNNPIAKIEEKLYYSIDDIILYSNRKNLFNEIEKSNDFQTLYPEAHYDITCKVMKFHNRKYKTKYKESDFKIIYNYIIQIENNNHKQ